MEPPVGESLTPSGVRRIPLPCGVNGIDFTNAYVIPDGDKLTVVDPGVWQPEPEDHGLGPLEAGLNAAGYAIRDISRIVVTHAHVDHYGMAGRIMETTGAELWMHAMTDLDTEKYRHPETAAMRRRDMYNDHGLSSDQVDQLYQSIETWMPYLYSVVEASKRLRGRRNIDYQKWRLAGDLHARAFTWPCLPVLEAGTAHCSRETIYCLESRRSRSNADSTMIPSRVISIHSRVSGRWLPTLSCRGMGLHSSAVRRIQAIQNNKARRLQRIREAIEERPRTATEIASGLFEKALLDLHKNLALTETLAHIAYLRWSGVIERRTRPDGAYEWFAVR